MICAIRKTKTLNLKINIMTKYQEKILKDLKNGAKLQCTEGSNYKVWLVYKNGVKRNVRRDSAEKVCAENDKLLIFGRQDGIEYR